MGQCFKLLATAYSTGLKAAVWSQSGYQQTCYSTGLVVTATTSVAVPQPCTIIIGLSSTPEQVPQVIVVAGQSIAKAGVFFSRPADIFPRTDGLDEQANLFNALWQSRLESLNNNDKMVLLALRAAQS